MIGDGTELSQRLKHCLSACYSYGKGRCVDFGYEITETADCGTGFKLYWHGKYEGSFYIGTIGEHNVYNATGALATAYLLGLDVAGAHAALTGFSGIARRLEHLGNIGTRRIYYDYAHHPTEIVGSLKAIKGTTDKVTVIFKPHTYTRTAALFSEFKEALMLADYTVVLDIYAAREPALPGIDAERLAAVIPGGVHLKDKDAVKYCLYNTVGDIVLMGAGEVEEVKEELLSLINKE